MHEVIVGNIGQVFYGIVNNGKTWRDAAKVFDTYVDYSKGNYGKSAGESVVWLKDDEPVKEYIGTVDLEDVD